MTTSLPRASCALVAALALFVGTSHAQTQTQTQTRVLELRGSHPSVTSFGAASVMLDDIDGDGHAEIVVGAADDDDAGTNAGAVYVKSGRTGETLRKIRGAFPGDGFGVSVASLGDVDGDGRSDMVVGAPFRPTATGRGVAHVVSAATGTVLHTLQGPGQDLHGD